MKKIFLALTLALALAATGFAFASTDNAVPPREAAAEAPEAAPVVEDVEVSGELPPALQLTACCVAQCDYARNDCNQACGGDIPCRIACNIEFQECAQSC